MKAKWLDKTKGHIVIMCPGCGRQHVMNVNPSRKPIWTFNGDLNNPTLQPSVKITVNGGKPNVCHFFVKNGMIEFQSDSTHKLSGQTVELPTIKK